MSTYYDSNGDQWEDEPGDDDPGYDVDLGYDPIAFVGPCHEAMYGLVATAQDSLETIKAQADNLAYDVENGFHLCPPIPF